MKNNITPSEQFHNPIGMKIIYLTLPCNLHMSDPYIQIDRYMYYTDILLYRHIMTVKYDCNISKVDIYYNKGSIATIEMEKRKENKLNGH